MYVGSVRVECVFDVCVFEASGCDGIVVGVCGVAGVVCEWGVRKVRDEVVVEDGGDT
jgi:hypothetical protein